MSDAILGTAQELLVLLLLLAGAALYFIPSVVALVRGTEDTGMVIVLNVFLGWTFLGWVVSLALAFASSRPRPSYPYLPTAASPQPYLAAPIPHVQTSHAPQPAGDSPQPAAAIAASDGVTH